MKLYLAYRYLSTLTVFVNKKNMLRERYRHAAVVVNNMIWLIGGRDAMDEIVREVDIYNPLTDE